MADHMPEAGTGMGEVLRRARTAAGLSIAEVSERLNLSARQIMALEAEDFATLPQAPYVKGYLRSYAALIGLSPPAVVALYDRQTQPAVAVAPPAAAAPEPAVIEIEKREVHHAKTGGGRWLLALIVLVAVGAAGYWVWRQMGRAAGRAHTVSASGAVVAPRAQGRTPSPVAGPSAAVPPNEPASSAPAPPLANLAPPGPQALPPPRRMRARSAPSFPGAGSYGQLVVVAGAPTQIEVQDNTGNTLLNERVPAGQPVSLDGLSPFTVTLTNSAGASVRYNGHSVPIPAGAGGPVRVVAGGGK